MGKKNQKHRRRLRKVRELKKVVPGQFGRRPGFSPTQFLGDYGFVIILIAIFFFGMWGLRTMVDKSKSSQKQIKEMVRSQFESRFQELQSLFPSGFIIFAINREGVFPGDYGTALNKIRVNWNDSRVIERKANQVTFELSQVRIPDEGVVPFNFETTIFYSPGFKVNLIQNDFLELTIMVLGVDPESLYAVIGARQVF